ncbi:6-bladed beta-propeller [Maribacter sp. 2304DJ31-5]|uniref:6-bladed beta-propeller n=1 Tax=Maribacter sp. 2304DJ31-5 TaxID=3386273 RepID=UPI0039BCB8BD
MKKLIRYLTIVVVFSFLGCKSDNIKKIEIKEEINIEKGETLKLSKLIKSYSYITLDEKELIGKIYKMKITKDGFYIHDNLGKSILKYNNVGEFSYRISKSGRGPEEYLRITDFIIDKSGRVEILNVGSHKRFWFDEKGNFLKQTEITSMDFNHTYFNESEIISYHHPGMNLKSKFALHIWDDKLNNLLNEDIEFGKYKDKFLNGSLYPFSKYQNTLNFCGDFSNIIYSINEQGIIQPKYRLNFNHYEWPPESEYKKFYDTNPYKFFDGMEEYIHFLNFIEDDQKACITFYQEKNKIHAFFNKTTKEVLCASKFEDDIGLGTTDFDIVANHEGYWYAIAETLNMDNIGILKEQGINISEKAPFIIIKFKL